MKALKTLVGLADKDSHYTFTIKKTQGFLKTFERYYFGATQKEWDWYAKETGMRISDLVDKVEIIKFPEYEMSIFFGKKKVILVVQATTRKVLLREKKNLLKYFTFA